MPRKQRSAGVVLYREEPSGGKRRLYLLLDYGHYWDFPKGHVEAGEGDESAALRELHEETGVADAKLVDGFAKEIVYFFRAGKGLVRKEVIFFIARTSRKVIKVSAEHSGFEWLDFDKALARLQFKNAKQILKDAENFLKRVTSA